jgi:2-amino-4-hydroxy-6-hydroxymethyldihydropteridine diphosphokinase
VSASEAGSTSHANSVVAYVSIGSNIEPHANIERALHGIAKNTRIIAISTFFQTQMLRSNGTVSHNQNDTFLNGVIAIQTELTPLALRDTVLRSVEQNLGRMRNGQKFDARKIDLDLVFYGNLVTNAEGLTLPRPDIRTRDFVAKPLLEIAPKLVLPDTHEPLAHIVPQATNTNMRPDVDFTQRLKKDFLK